ncbi:MAG: hypothetical protein HQL38_04225 [Alphaproteobacteria bacterium]|nr:hypothetical protein [Alphaproteobacteria bacterium]MBF0391868.1 hypothetical protein [Alphaproteobacteria bacterium]
MDDEIESLILRAYGEAVLAAREKGMSGMAAQNAAYQAAAKVASRVAGTTVTVEQVAQVVRG